MTIPDTVPGPDSPIWKPLREEPSHTPKTDPRPSPATPGGPGGPRDKPPKRTKTGGN